MVFFKWRREREWEALDRGLKGAGVLLAAVGMAGKEAACPGQCPELAHGGAALGTGVQQCLLSPWAGRGGQEETPWAGVTLELPQAPGVPGVHPPDPRGSGQGCRPWVSGSWAQPQLWGVCWLHELRADCSGTARTGSLRVPPPHGSWLGQRCCLSWWALAGAVAALCSPNAAFTPSAGVLNPFRLALLPENREGLNYEDLEYASFHGVAKDICLSTL